jgi:hypothetical protein
VECVDQILKETTLTTLPSIKHRYIRWEFTRALFEGKNDQAVQWILEKAKPEAIMPPIFVEASVGGPFGTFIKKMITRGEYAPAIAAQSVGTVNPFPCSHCEALLRDSDRLGSRGMAPFFGCVSFVPYHRCCANCMMWGRRTICEWVVHGQTLDQLQSQSKLSLGMDASRTGEGLTLSGQELVRMAKDIFGADKPQW